jgi:hypothetical protein
MLDANPRQHLKIGTPDRRCWTCAAFVEADGLPSTAQPLGTCTKVRWLLTIRGNNVRQDVHADDVCAKHEPAFGREAQAVRMGLG